MRPDDRLAVIEQFFELFPGPDRRPPGLGLAVVDFARWALESGRLSDNGSRWWSAVNMALVRDLQNAIDGRSSPWTEYTTASPAEAQRAFWQAHQRSIRRGAENAVGMLEREPPSEREFIRIALLVVEMSADLERPTDDPRLGKSTRAYYPSTYPCPEADLLRLRKLLASAGVPTQAPGPPGDQSGRR